VVHEAGSGTEGLEVLKDKQVDLILSDINMPSMDGLEFLRQIRAQNLAPGVPVVMITTESSEEHVKQAILAGAQGYIRKPFTAEQVKERVLPLVQRGYREGIKHAVERCAVGRNRAAGRGGRGETKWSVRWRYRCVNPCNWSPIRGTWMRAWKRSFNDAGSRVQRDRTGRFQEPESVTAVVGFGGLLSGACVFRGSGRRP
jgi:two-component system, chemotaxis family, chemotaxis protein CheY